MRSSHRLAYRPDIDGVRTLAVAFVIAYHFGIPGISGGYLGVDLFFVVSGFLIASIFDGEPTLTGAVLAGFYNRRIKRLMPAFLAVAAITTAAATALLLPDDYTAFLKSVRESFEFKSNVFFERETTGYFAADAATLPWLHTWSLAIEWQFYAAFPALLWLIRRASSARTRGWLLATATLAAIVASAWMTAVQPAHAYFSPIARAFEFLVGALATTIRLPALRARAALAISVIGVAALVALAAVFERSTPFPGVNALAVCAIGFVLIVTGRHGSILAHRTLAAVGKRSYSAYLWHWPVVAFLAYVQVASPPWQVALWIMTIGIASEATYRAVERRGLALTWKLPRTLIILCVLPLCAFTVGNLVVRKHDGYASRLGPEAERVAATLKRYESSRLEPCHDFNGPDVEACAFGDLASSRRALLIGDSHARHFEPFVAVLAEAARVKVHGLTNAECLAVEGVRLPPRFTTAAACSAAIARDMARIRDERYDYVILADRWIGYPLDQVQRLDATIATIVRSGAIPIVFKEVAENGSNPKDCFYRPIKTREARTESCAIRQDDAWAAEARRTTIALIDALKSTYPTLRIVDPQAVQCRNGECATIIDGTPIYSDTHHLDAFGSTMLGRDYLKRFGNPFERDAVALNPTPRD